MSETKLDPGIYLQIGSHVTEIKTANADMWRRLISGDRTASIETLAAMGWTYIALSKRREQLSEIDIAWRLNDNDMDAPPYGLREMELLARTDMSWQVYGYAYWYKLRTTGGNLRVQWLDPATIEPDYDQLDKDGQVQYFTRRVDRGVQRLLARDVVWFKAAGLRELEPGPSAAMATRIAADLLYGADLALASLFGNNALPIYLINVPPGTSEPAKQELESKWRRLINPKRRGSVDMRSMAVSSDVGIERLSLSPGELALEAIDASNRTEILAAHGVPDALVMGDAANMATADIYQTQFIGTMTARLNQIADVLDHDPDFGGRGFTMHPQPQRLPAMQSRRLSMIQGLAQALQSGMMTADEAREVLDLEPMEVTPMPEAAALDEPPQEMAARSWAWDDEAAQFRRWYKKRTGAEVEEFKSNHLTYADKLEIAAAVDGYSWHDYP